MLAYRLTGSDLIVSIDGELDQLSAQTLRAQLDELIEQYRPRRLVLDVANLEFMDSSGIGMLIGRYKRMKRAGGSMAIRGARGPVEKLFALSGLYQILERLA